MYSFGNAVAGWFYKNFELESAYLETRYWLDTAYDNAYEKAVNCEDEKEVETLMLEKTYPDSVNCAYITLEGKLMNKNVKIEVYGNGNHADWIDPLDFKLGAILHICSKALTCNEDANKLERLPELGYITIEDYLNKYDSINEPVKIYITRDFVVTTPECKNKTTIIETEDDINKLVQTVRKSAKTKEEN